MRRKRLGEKPKPKRKRRGKRDKSPIRLLRELWLRNKARATKGCSRFRSRNTGITWALRAPTGGTRGPRALANQMRLYRIKISPPNAERSRRIGIRHLPDG